MFELIYEPWFRLLLVVIIIAIFSKIFARVVLSVLKKFATLTKSKRDDILIKKIEFPFMILVGLFALRFGFEFFQILPNYLPTSLKIIDTIIILFIARIVTVTVYLIFEIWSSNVGKNKKIQIDDQVIIAIEKSLGFVVYVIAIGYIMSVWEIDLWPVLGSLGVAGIALAFALQETLKNLFGGIQLIVDKNFKKGDIIELSTGTSGTIYDITLRSTRIKTWDNKMIIIPNAVMANDVITNITQPDRSRRITLPFGVEYGSDPDYVKAICMEEIMSIEVVEKEDPAPRILFRSMADSALTFEALFWVKDLSNFIDAREDATTKIYERLNREGIGIPFPQMTIWNNDMGKPHIRPYRKKKLPGKK